MATAQPGGQPIGQPGRAGQTEALEREGGARVPQAPGVADPAPLGLAGFAMTTVLLGLINAGLISDKSLGGVIVLAIAYGGLAQLLAGMWAFRENNTFAAVAFTSYGAFWLSFVALEKGFGGAVPPHGAAAYLILWGVFTFYMWIATFRLNVGLNLVFLTLWIAFILLGIADTGSAMHPTIMHIGGGFTIAAGVFAWYVSAAIVINKTIGKDILPLIPLGRRAATRTAAA